MTQHYKLSGWVYDPVVQTFGVGIMTQYCRLSFSVGIMIQYYTLSGSVL